MQQFMGNGKIVSDITYYNNREIPLTRATIHISDWRLGKIYNTYLVCNFWGEVLGEKAHNLLKEGDFISVAGKLVTKKFKVGNNFNSMINLDVSEFKVLIKSQKNNNDGTTIDMSLLGEDCNRFIETGENEDD